MVRKCRDTENKLVLLETVQQLDRIVAFNWGRDYAPHWEGRNDGSLNDILFAPGPNDVITIDGITAPYRMHLDGTAARLLGPQPVQYNERGNRVGRIITARRV